MARLRLLGCITASILVATALAAPRPPIAKPVSFAILEDYDKGDDLADIERDFALFNELEIRTWRGSFGWDDYEPARGRLDLDWLGRFVAAAAARGIQLRPYLGYTPAWAARRGGADGDAWNNPPADIARWERFASEVARRLRGHPNILSYEIYNEENVKQWWDGDAAAYGRVLARGARAIRQFDPDAAILFGGLVFPDREFIEAACAAPGVRGSFDVLPFHAYPETWTPPGVTAENYLGGLDDFIRAADAACGRRPIWINETGFATVPGKAEREQASWWVRATATFLAHPRVEHIGVYEIKDLPTDRPVIGDAPNYHLGLTGVDRTKKLAFHTVDLLTDLLDVGTLLIEEVDLTVSGAAADVHVHLFGRPDGDRVMFAWTSGPSRTATIRVGRPSSSATEFSLDGRPMRVEGFDGTTFVDLRLGADAPRIFRLSR